MNPLTAQKIITPAESELLFANIVEIYNLHNQFIKDIQEAEESTDSNIGNLLLVVTRY